MSESEPAVHGTTQPTPLRCELGFCRDLPGRLEPGELYVMAADRNQPEAWARSQYLLEHSLAAFHKGEGDVRRVVVPLDPTLDDMLAATFCTWLLAGRKLPAGAEKFSRYAAMAREGLRPSKLPLEATLEGVFMAIRNISGEDLSRPDTAARFVADWWRMSDRIMQAAAEGLDPRTATLLDGLEFSREQTYLADDHKVFLNDLAHGEIWTVDLPGGTQNARGVLLRQPKSLLFKYFCRSDAGVPGSRAFEFMAVQWGPGEWVFSTDPVKRLSLAGLHAVLQQAEQAHDAQRAESDPWFDGAPFQHSLVFSPKGRSILADDEILRLVRRWARAQPERSPAKKRLLAAGVAGAVLLLAGWATGFPWPASPSKTSRSSLTTTTMAAGHSGGRGDNGGPPPVPTPPAGPRSLHALAVGISKYQQKQFSLGFGRADAESFRDLVNHQRGQLFQNADAIALVDEQATEDGIRNGLQQLRKSLVQFDLAMILLAGHGLTDENGNYFFVPYDFDHTKNFGTTCISWNDLSQEICSMPCKVLIVLDTCHSGLATRMGLRARDIDRNSISVKAKQAFGKSDGGVVILAAALGSQAAVEDSAWQHGALTLALLEGIENKRLFAPLHSTRLPSEDQNDGVVNLADLNYYVTKRVNELTKGGQAVVTTNTGDFSLSQIEISKFASAPSVETAASAPAAAGN